MKMLPAPAKTKKTAGKNTVGTKTEHPRKMAREMTVQLITRDTIRAGLPFGLRLVVEANEATEAITAAAEQIAALRRSIRLELVEEANAWFFP